MSAVTWDDVLTAALLGTDRRSLDPADLPDDLGAVGARLPATDAPGRLLGAAVLLTTARRAGTTGARTERPAPEPAPQETAAVVGGAARERLAGLLARSDGEGVALLTEWLHVAAERALVAPPSLLPQLLDLAGRRRELAPGVRAVLGERGRWLASFDPAWSTAAALDEPPVPSRPAPDEAALDAALAGRSSEVRATALDLAAQLPEAQFTADVTTKALASLSLTGGALAVHLPADVSPLRSPDPFPATPPGTGAAAWRLHQLVAATPLTVWERTFGLTPEQLLALPVTGDYRPGLHQSWHLATERQRSRPWARALLAADPAWARTGLLAILTRDDRADVVEQWFRSAGSPVLLDAALTLAIQAMPGPWHPRLRDAVLAVVAAPERPADALAARARTHLTSALTPDAPTEDRVRAAAADRTDSPPWHSALLHVADHLFTRRQMLEELR
ncbi:DUF5691 domain-containing protein [Cellulomonas sp. P5_C5]